MSDIRVKVGQQNSIKSRVGQQNTIKVVSSVSGVAGGFAVLSENVIGGIASVTSLNVSGISSFVGISTFKNNVFIDGNLYVDGGISFIEFITQNANISGILTVSGGFYYDNYYPSGVAYFNSDGLMVSTGSTNFAIDYTNYILTVNNSGTPTWSSVIDGGSY